MSTIRKYQTKASILNQEMQILFFKAIGCLSWLLVPGSWCLVSAWFLLSGCSTTSETFDCKEGKGVGCKSISEVNRMVDQGMLRDGSSEVGGSVSMMPSPCPIILAGPHDEKNTSTLTDISLAEGITVQRIQEEALRVWIAPFQDDQGNLHGPSVIHTVLTPGYWGVVNAPTPRAKLQEPGEENN